VASMAAQLGAKASAPANDEVVRIAGRGARVLLELPHALLQGRSRVIAGEGLQGLSKQVTCQLAAIEGRVGETMSSGTDGTRVVRWLTSGAVNGTSNAVSATAKGGPTDKESEEVVRDKEGGKSVSEETRASSSHEALVVDESEVLLVSVGEVLLDSVRQQLDSRGVSTEYHLSSSGGYVLCDGQVLLRKGQENDFLLEGPPTAAFYQTRQALYQQFAFV